MAGKLSRPCHSPWADSRLPQKLLLVIAREKFRIDKDADISCADAVDPELVQAFENGDDDGPEITDVVWQYDWGADHTTSWNDQVGANLLQVLTTRAAEARLPDIEEAEKLDIVAQRLRTMRLSWSKAQLRYMDGEWETEEAKVARSKEESARYHKANRQRQRRYKVGYQALTMTLADSVFQSYSNRRWAVIHEILIREEQQSGDLQIWKFLLDLLDELGADGMSSDESEGGNRDFFRVKLLPWRRDISREMGIIDGAYTKLKDKMRKTGGKAIPRHRDGGLVSSREAPSDYPRALYDDEWFKNLGRMEERVYSVSKKVFEFVELMLDN